MSDSGRSVRSYHSPAPLRHSSHAGPPSHQPSPQRQVRFGDKQKYLEPDFELEEDEVMESEEVGEEDGVDVSMEDASELRVKSVMAISATKGRVGMCLYNQSDHKLLFIEDQQDSENWDLVRLSKPLQSDHSSLLLVCCADSSGPVS